MDSTYNLNGGFKPTLKRFADLEGPDYFPTPAWATWALIANETFEGEIWEPACGDGAMARVLERTGCKVISTDLFDRGFGDPGVDFLTSERIADNVITNPPYNAAEAFVKAGLLQRVGSWRCCFGSRSSRAPIGSGRFSRRRRRRGFGCLVSGLRSIRPARCRRAVGRRRMPGLFGTSRILADAR